MICRALSGPCRRATSENDEVNETANFDQLPSVEAGWARALLKSGRTILAGGTGARAVGGDFSGAGLSLEGVGFGSRAKRLSCELAGRRRHAQLRASPEPSPGGTGGS